MGEKPTDMTRAPQAKSSIAPLGRVSLPVVRLDGRRRLHGSVWAEPFPPAGAAMPIKRSRLTGMIGKTMAACGLAIVVLSGSGAIPTNLSKLSVAPRLTGAVVTSAAALAILLARDPIDRWWFGVASARMARRWPAVTVFGVFLDTRPPRDGWAIVALHPEAHGEHRYRRQGVVVGELGAAPPPTARAWHQQLLEINQRAAAALEDNHELVLELQT